MIKYQIKVDNKAVLDALRRLSAVSEDLTPAMQDIGELLLKSTKRRFETSTGPDGRPWAPNALSTLMRFAAARGGFLKRRGRGGIRGFTSKSAQAVAVKKPLIGETQRLSTEIVVHASARQVEVGSPLIQAAVQQFGARKGQFGRTRRGAPIPWGNIPARPFVGISPDDADGIVEILKEHLARAVGQ